MYRSFYNLDQKPFMQAGEPSFFWVGGRRTAIFEEMYDGVLKNDGFLLLTGAEGFGKTATLKALARSLRTEVVCGIVKGPFANKIDWYNGIGQAFGLDREFTSKVQFLLYFGQFLHDSEAQGKNVLLAVDDCHTLSPDLLEDIRAISNIRNDEGTRLITIILAGKPELYEMLDQPGNMIIRLQVSSDHVLEPLDHGEVQDYIAHRLKTAGYGGAGLFSGEAVETLCRRSRGNLSEINRLCEAALVLGADAGQPVIDSRTVDAAVDPLNLARVAQATLKTAAPGGESGTVVSRETVNPDKAPAGRRQQLDRMRKIQGIKMWAGIIVVAVLVAVIFLLPDSREPAKGNYTAAPTAPLPVPGQPLPAGEEKAIENPAPERAGENKAGKAGTAAVAAGDFWQSRKDDNRLVKVDRENLETFISGFVKLPDTVFLLRPEGGESSEKLVRDMQTLLVRQGIGPAQVKVMRAEEEPLVEIVAEIAHLEGHRVLEVIVVRDGIWWGELGRRKPGD
jgi:general secretion pathway protein A